MLFKEKRKKLINFERRVFDVKNEPMAKGDWWYWFWLFFFDNKKNPEKPRQLMLVWSTKNEKEMEYNNQKIRLAPLEDRKNLDGVVAAWYFDGERMHHGFLSEKCKIKLSDRKLFTDCTIPTSFHVNKDRSIVKIGDDFNFTAETRDCSSFNSLSYELFVSKKVFSIMELKRLNIKGKVRDEPVKGTAYFQRVFFDMPYPSWYWGIFHFENKSILTYGNSFVLGRSFKKDISFFDGKRVHFFDRMKVKKSGKEKLVFDVYGENKEEEIRFTVKSYSHTCWAFKKKTLGLIPTSLIYNEYPATVSKFELVNKKTGVKTVLKELGKSVGNAEYGSGLLI
jgi:hypothetical protein